MSSGLSSNSGDDQPRNIKPNSRVQPNGHIASSNGKASASVEHDEYSSMSEDDVPLSQSSSRKFEPAVPNDRSLKRKKGGFSSSSDSDTPLASSPAKQMKTATVRMPGAHNATTIPADAVNGNGRHKAASLNDHRELSAFSDSDDDKPVTKKKPPTNGKGPSKAPPKKKVKKEDDSIFSEDDEPIVQKRKRAPAANGNAKKGALQKDDETSDDDKLLAKKPPKKVKKQETLSDANATPKPKKVASRVKKEEEAGSSKKVTTKKNKEVEEEGEEVFKWWEQEDPNGDGTVKWQTLEHNGVFFPPPYEPLPSNVKMKYAGSDVNLPHAAEEVAGFYGAMLETDHAQDKIFNQNFFHDFKKVLKKNPPLDGTEIEKFELCDFRPMFEHFEAEKAKKKAMTTAEKKEMKKAKDTMEEKFTTCTLDGRKEKVGNFRIEPPGLFRGRGEHPKKGCLKFRVTPEDIIINIQEGARIPAPNMPGKWKKVIHDQTVTWLANWTENVNGQHKYVFLAAGSSLKGQSDMNKFEKARELKNHVDRIRQDYYSDLKSKVMADRQRATAMYFIDRLALRAGNEKGEDEADTVGCCSLRCEHVTLQQPDTIIFDFLGKDSIRYFKDVPVDAQVFKNIRIFKENKNDDDALFDRVNTSMLNKHLASYMKGLTAKVFRTYNASITFQQQLDDNTPQNATTQEKLVAYNKANKMVAILCNHQRSVPKTHSASMEKMGDKLRSFKYDRMKLRHVLFGLDAKYKKHKAYAEDESDIDDDWIEAHEKSLKEKEIEKAEKKFAKENEKLEADGAKAQSNSVLKERLQEIEEEFERLEGERGTGKATLKRPRAVEKIEEGIAKLDEKMKNFKLQIEDREDGKEVSLGTSKINYLDPRITSAWCKIHDVPIEKIFSKTLLTKFPWAREVDGDWKF